jgi:hypothetical protein
MFRGVVLQFEPVLLTAIPPRIDNRELRFLFFWPLHLGSAFINALRQRHSGALAILMYYATILVVAEARYWFLQTGMLRRAGRGLDSSRAMARQVNLQVYMCDDH